MVRGDTDGVTLPPELVKEGHMNEMKGFEQRLENTICQRSECTGKIIHPIGVRWVLVAKKGAVTSGLVAQDFNFNGKAEVERFSPTPSFLSSWWLPASQGGGRVGGKRVMCIDFACTFLYGCVDRDVHM